MRAIQWIAGVAAFAIALAVLAYLADNLRTETFQSVATVTIDTELPDLTRQEIIGTALETVDDPAFAARIDEAEGLVGTMSELRAERSNGGLRVVAEAETRQAARSAAEGAAEAILLERSAVRAGELEPTLIEVEDAITDLDRLLADPATADPAREEAEAARSELLLERGETIAALERDELEITEVDSSDSPIRPRPGRTALLVGLVASALGLFVVGRRARSTSEEGSSDEPTPTRTEAGLSEPTPATKIQKKTQKKTQKKATMSKNSKGKTPAPSMLDDPEATIVPPRITTPPKAADAPAPAAKSDPAAPADAVTPEAPPAMPMESAGPKLSQRLSDPADAAKIQPISTGAARFGRNGDTAAAAGPPAMIQAKGKKAEAAKPVPSRPPVPTDAASTASGHSDGRLDVVSYHVSGLDDVAIVLLTDLDDVEQGHEGAARLTEDLVRRGFAAAHVKLVGSSDSATLAKTEKWLSGGPSDPKPEQSDQAESKEVKQLTVEFERHRAADIAAAIAKLAKDVDKVVVSSNSVGGRSAQLELARMADGVVIQAEPQADTTDAARDFERIKVRHLATLRLTPQRRGLPLWVAAAGLIALLGAGVLAGYLALRDDDGTSAQTAADPAATATTLPAAGATTVAPAPSVVDPVETPTSLPPPGAAGTVPPGVQPVTPTEPVGVPTPDLVFNLPPDLPAIEAARRHRGVYDGGVLYLEGEVASEEEAADFEERAIAILGEQNVVNNYVINPEAPESTDGRIIIADPFLFGSGSSSMVGADQELLGLGILVLQTFPDVVFRVSAYTDNIGDPDDNLALSKRRGDAFVQFYTQQGFEAARFEVVPKGEAEPVATNTTAEGRAQNRRLEVELLGLLSGE